MGVKCKGMARMSGQVEGSGEFLSAHRGHIVVVTGGYGDTECPADRVFADHVGSVSGGALERYINFAVGLVG